MVTDASPGRLSDSNSGAGGGRRFRGALRNFELDLPKVRDRDALASVQDLDPDHLAAVVEVQDNARLHFFRLHNLRVVQLLPSLLAGRRRSERRPRDEHRGGVFGHRETAGLAWPKVLGGGLRVVCPRSYPRPPDRRRSAGERTRRLLTFALQGPSRRASSRSASRST